MWEPNFQEWDTHEEKFDHETKLINNVMRTFTNEQWKMLDQYDWLEEWFQAFANHFNGVN